MSNETEDEVKPWEDLRIPTTPEALVRAMAPRPHAARPAPTGTDGQTTERTTGSAGRNR